MGESDAVGFVRKYDLPVVKSPCPADGRTKREYAKQLLLRLNRENPGVRERMFSAIQNKTEIGWPEAAARDILRGALEERPSGQP